MYEQISCLAGDRAEPEKKSQRKRTPYNEAHMSGLGCSEPIRARLRCSIKSAMSHSVAAAVVYMFAWEYMYMCDIRSNYEWVS